MDHFFHHNLGLKRPIEDLTEAIHYAGLSCSERLQNDIFGRVHKLSPGNPGYDPTVHKLITETGSIVYERLVLYPGHAPYDSARE